MVEKLTFVTGNPNKAKEVELILGLPIETVNLEVDEVQSLDLVEIAYKKAISAFTQLGKPLIVEDAGLFLDAWQGFPGPFVKFLLESGGNSLILKLLEGLTNRQATAKAVFALHDGKQVHTFLGEIAGKISDQEKGEGWGWDPIFIPKTSEKTYAELGAEEKNKVSHRRIALERFKEFLKVS